MATRLERGKVVRRLLRVDNREGPPVDLDITISERGITFRKPETTNRKTAFAPWWVICQNVGDVKKGYRLWSLEQMLAHLDDPPPPKMQGRAQKGIVR